MNTYKPNHTQN